MERWCSLIRCFCRVLGDSNKNLPKIVEVLTIILSREALLEEKWQSQAVALFKQLQNSVPAQVASSRKSLQSAKFLSLIPRTGLIC